jgi:hypothetical protein
LESWLWLHGDGTAPVGFKSPSGQEPVGTNNSLRF